MSWVLTISQITFTILTTMCTVFDIVLLLSVIKQRFFTSSTSKTPFVYITAMTLSGIIGKFADFFMVDAWPIGDLIDPVNGYENYRKLIGKQITLIATYCYLIAIFLNCLMTCHRVSILCSPAKAPQWFTDIKLALYSMSIMLILFVVLLIPYYSECSLNFNARASFHEAACAPKRHQLTLIQNQYLIWVPVSAVTVNVSMILYIKFSRKFIKKPISLSLTTIKRENEMIRQACFIATEISIFEVGYLFMRLYPDEFESLPQEVQTITYLVRLFAFCSLNFFVYFVETKSTRNLVLNYIGWRTNSTKLVTPTIVSITQVKRIS